MISTPTTQLSYNNKIIAYHNHEIRNVQIFLACSLPVYLYRPEKDNLQRKNTKKDGSHSIRVALPWHLSDIIKLPSPSTYFL
mmetsp:Transcript_817/g.1255  ORF Transcript_817/g.1255 Transcript_817/m.1255 type:complete len:82 (+) Transcript_817:119-364(+)